MARKKKKTPEERRHNLQSQVDQQLQKLDEKLQRGRITRNKYEWRRARILAQLNTNTVKPISAATLKSTLGFVRKSGRRISGTVPGGLPESGKR